MWGFTVVRREPPPPGHKNSVYTYLAPLNAMSQPALGQVLRFPADALEMLPDDTHASTTAAPVPYSRSAAHGTLIKLYDYLQRLPKRGVCTTTSFSLLRHLEVCLLNLALPAKVYDCRYPSGHKQHPTNSQPMYGLASLWVPIIRSWALTRGFALHPGTRNRYEIRCTRTQHRPPSRQVNDHGRVSGTHRPSTACELYAIATRIDEHLLRWAMQKFKRLRGQPTKAWRWLDAARQREPQLFAHWHLVASTPRRTVGAV